ncbi:hypothetical protein CPB84DRAFT_1707912 [Gymnopilus junonius]|uniref:SET domain-containing protein n=1 Tax=Gymnopilus junonius TaxID=109634 RepID=A0A9P5NPM1_GYMJU|nr:hypothetical protein CPB84DRAFT_1707912 [Gymnopilus junonius]
MEGSDVHPRWFALLKWLSGHGMDVSQEKLPVVARSTPDAGYGLFSLRSIIEPATPLFTIPASALLNHLTLAPHYPPTKPELTCTQFISLHLLLHRPLNGGQSSDPLFGPYISVLPQSFDFHPLIWLWKRRSDPSRSTLESRLVKCLPSSILAKLDKILSLFDKDWRRIQDYLRLNPSLIDDRNRIVNGIHFEQDYLWAWLNVNTRCVYHRLAKTQTDQNNMTLCPILDLANHTPTPPYTMPQATRAELWGIGPSSRRKYGEDFVLLSPSTSSTRCNEEMFLRYGAHSNATLFAEYGFVNQPNSEQDHNDYELDLGKVIEDLFSERGDIGYWMREVLIEEGYWGDWTLHFSPVPAHPSYRLITALRLYHLLPVSADDIPPGSDSTLQVWRDTMFGKRGTISEENEGLWKGTLSKICKDIIERGKGGLKMTVNIQEQGSPTWLQPAKACIETLWREEIDVAIAVARSLEDNEEF